METRQKSPKVGQRDGTIKTAYPRGDQITL